MATAWESSWSISFLKFSVSSCIKFKNKENVHVLLAWSQFTKVYRCRERDKRFCRLCFGIRHHPSTPKTRNRNSLKTKQEDDDCFGIVPQICEVQNCTAHRRISLVFSIKASRRDLQKRFWVWFGVRESKLAISLNEKNHRTVILKWIVTHVLFQWRNISLPSSCTCVHECAGLGRDCTVWGARICFKVEHVLDQCEFNSEAWHGCRGRSKGVH